MEVNFFKNIGKLDIGGGEFNVYNGANNSQKKEIRSYSTTLNDHSQHTTSYGNYTNYGQHAQDQGQINNYGPQTTNHGPVYGYRQYAPAYHHENDWTPSSSDDDNVSSYYQPPPNGQNSWYVAPDRYVPGNRDYFGATQSDARFGNQRTKQSASPRAKAEQRNCPTKEFDPTSQQFQAEYETMTPKMKEYLQKLGYVHDPRDSLSKGMANVSLDDADPRRSPSPRTFGRRTPETSQMGRNDLSYVSDEEEDTGELDPDFVNGDSKKYSYKYTHNDNRVITTNVNSHNTNTENVVDSYNDNSTRTDIKKNSARG